MNELSLSPKRTSRPVLFYDELSPMSRSCLMLIELARLDVDIRFVDLTHGENFREEFILLNPTLTVPILVHDNQVIVGSTILIYLCDYTCSKVAQEIYPDDNCTRIQILNRLFFESSMLARRHSDIMTELMSKAYLESDMERDCKKTYHMYDVLETYLCGSKYMVGDSVTIADIAILSTLLGFDLIFPIVGMECNWPRLSKWFMNVSRLPGYNHIQKGVDRQRWVVETAGQFQFSSIKILPDMLKDQGNNMRCQKEFTQYSSNCKRSSPSDNMIGEQMFQNGVIVIPPMTEESVSPNSTLVDQQGQFLCCEYNYPYPSEREQQQPCIIKSIIATANKPKSCNCVRIFEDVGCDTGSPRTMSARENCSENSKNCSENSSRKDRCMNSKKDSKNLSEVSVVPVSEIPCYSTCDECDCSYKPLPTNRPLIPLDKNQMEDNCQRQNRECDTNIEDSSYPKQTHACESVSRSCACKTDSALCPVITPCERFAQTPASERRESPTKSISSELFQRVQKQTAYNTDQNCNPRTNLLNKNSDSMFSFNTNLFQSNMGRQDPPCRKQVPTSSDIPFNNNFHMYERQSFSCPMRSYSREDDGRFLSYSMPPEVISMSYPNDPEFEVIRRTSNPSYMTSMYTMAGSINNNGRTYTSPRQYAQSYSQMPMNENAPFHNMSPRGYGNHSDCCPIHSRANNGLNRPFNNQEGYLNMMTEAEPCASHVCNSVDHRYPTDYNDINNRRDLSLSRKRSIKPTPPTPPPSPINACKCNKWNSNTSASSQAQQEKQSTIIDDDTNDKIKPAVADSSNADEQALANYSEFPKTTTTSDNLKSSNQNRRGSTESESKLPEIRISVLVHEHEHQKRSTHSKERSEHGKRSSISGEQSEQEKLSPISEEQSEQEKLSPVPVEQSEQEKLSPIPEEQSEQEKLSPVPEDKSEQEKLSPVPEDKSEQEKRSSISEEQTEQNEVSPSRESRRESIGLYIPGHRPPCNRRNTEEIHRMTRHSIDPSRHNPSPADNHPQ